MIYGAKFTGNILLSFYHAQARQASMAEKPDIPAEL
jgi:hypothetical protein